MTSLPSEPSSSGGVVQPTAMKVALPPASMAVGRNSWVPIRKLAPRHRGRVLAHLTSLEARDRYLRFGFIASDEQLARYVEGLDFHRDEIFGIFNRRLDLIGWAHLAFARLQPLTSPSMAEFGVSVASQARGRGFGARLFDHAVLLARNRGVDTLFIQALTENATMLRLARKAGATVERLGSESEARLKLPPDTLASKVEEMMGARAAELDYQLKAHTHRVDRWLDSMHGSTDEPGDKRNDDIG